MTAEGAVRRRRRRPAFAAALAGVLAACAVLVTFPPPLVAGWWADPRPWPLAGQRLPQVTEAPLARIAVAGDTGTGSEAAYRTARRMLLESRTLPYDALVLLGDLVYEDGDAERVEEVVFEPFAGVLATATLVPALGNHDYLSGEQQRILDALGRDASWYVERVGPVQLVVLDSNRVEDAQQLAWLRATLSASRAPGTWTVVAAHHPAYSAGHHGSDSSVRRTWGPLFEQHDVPLVLAGHDHDYQRSTTRNGVTYVVSGAGAKVRPTGRREFTAVSSSTLHYLDVLVYADRLLIRAVDQSGRLIDSFTVRRLPQSMGE